ncbi:unnamed protein product [Rotaria sp. Silwood2]|nr:unnamed protein product [Rotaria sp. Silwood2]CAF4244437.1 unnamed protein product [Rotaria sp. Silwood2]
MENNNNTTTTITDQLNSLRSILHSDDHLQIYPSGDYVQVRIKLNHDIQISFFFDSLNILNKPLTINNLHDLRIKKSSNNCPLDKDQWTNIRQYFYELIQQSNESTSIQSVIQSIQDYSVSIMTNNKKSRRKEKKSTEISAGEDTSALTNRFRHSDIIFNRILHDKTIDRSQVVIGYEDRFIGIHEIPFNEFKRVHEHEYGIPLHRIRHFKLNGNLVWDRRKRLDLITGSQQQNVISNDDYQYLSLVQGLYYFDHSLQQWIECPHIPLTSDDPRIPSTSETWLPERCHFVTWNILFDYYQSTLIHSQQRYQAILDTLKSVLPDIICLQEVTKSFLNLLLNELWFQQNNYYVIIMKSIINSDEEKSYGQLMIMKNFRPRSFSICSLDLSEDDELESPTTTTTRKYKAKKELIIARFGLNARVTIDLVNLHLHSDLARNSTEKRCQTLYNLFRTMKTYNYMLIGDFNFGDAHSKEQNILAAYEKDVHDLWKEVYRLDENPGFTFDPSRNICAQITSRSQKNRRLDRYLIHTLYNLSYSIEHLSMIAVDTIPIDPFNNDDSQRINLSDHYALQLMINFQTRSISHRSALVILPTTDKWSLIDSYCGYYDSSTSLWPSHINLLWPFYDLNDCQDDQEDILLKLRLLLCQYSSFSIQINEIDSFVENNVSYMKCDEQSVNHLKQLHEQLAQLFSHCLKNSRNTYNPHMTVAQFDSKEKFNQAKPSLILNESFKFPVQHLYILQRPHDNDTTPFHIVHQIPLGPRLQPICFKQLNSVHTKLQEFFQIMNLYETHESYKRKQDKFEKLSSCFQQIFNKDTLHCFTHSFLSYGSFRIGINGQDVDTVFLLNEIKSINSETTFDETLHQLKHDSSALNKHIVNLLETQINENFKDELIYCRKIEALFPIISILFNDQTKVEIFVQIELNNEQTIERKAANDSHRPGSAIHGVHDIERLFVHIRSPPIFQHLLTYIRTWAQHVGLYGQVYGYLSGYAWAILCAHICHKYLSPIKSLLSIEEFSIDEFFSLVKYFFSTFAQFNWSADAFCLYPKSYKPITYSGRPSVYQRGSMRIISPSPPFNNAARSTKKSTRDLIIQGFQRVVQLLDSINTITTEDKSNALKQILELNNDFPSEKTESIIQLTISSQNTDEFDSWLGWIRSRFSFFFSDCEEACHYTFQPQNAIEYQSNKIEALYSIAFQVDSTTLQQCRKFTVCLKKFIDQVNSFSNRTKSMKFSHEIISIDDWKLKQMKPKSQRIKQ